METKQNEREQRRLMSKAANAVCVAFDIDRALLTKRNRTRNVADARMTLCALLTEKQVRTDVIAEFVKRNRSNVLHSNRTICALENSDKQLTAKIQRARRLLNAEDYTERIADEAYEQVDFGNDRQSIDFETTIEKDGVVNYIGFDLNVEFWLGGEEYEREHLQGYASVDYCDITAHIVGDPDAECDPTISVDFDWLEELITNHINNDL